MDTFVKAYQYTRYYMTDYIHELTGKTSELFIPSYELTVCIVNNVLYVNHSTEPRTQPPLMNIINDNCDGEIREILEKENERIRNLYPPSPLTEILISEETCERMKTIYHLQKNLDQQKTTLMVDIKKLI